MQDMIVALFSNSNVNQIFGFLMKKKMQCMYTEYGALTVPEYLH